MSIGNDALLDNVQRLLLVILITGFIFLRCSTLALDTAGTPTAIR